MGGGASKTAHASVPDAEASSVTVLLSLSGLAGEENRFRAAYDTAREHAPGAALTRAQFLAHAGAPRCGAADAGEEALSGASYT